MKRDGYYCAAFGNIAIDKKVEKALQCHFGRLSCASCVQCSTAAALEKIQELFWILGWSLDVVSEKEVRVTKLPPPPPWKPEPWQQVFPGSLEGWTDGACDKHGPNCIGHVAPTSTSVPAVSAIDYRCIMPDCPDSGFMALDGYCAKHAARVGP